MARLSPGSPSKWIATRSPSPASTWRSTQLYATLSVPSLNHLANGGLDQSSVSVGSLAQVSRRACSAQKPSRSALACSYASAVTLAFAANSAGGAKRRSSFKRLARLSLLTTSPLRCFAGRPLCPKPQLIRRCPLVTRGVGELV